MCSWLYILGLSALTCALLPRANSTLVHHQHPAPPVSEAPDQEKQAQVGSPALPLEQASALNGTKPAALASTVAGARVCENSSCAATNQPLEAKQNGGHSDSSRGLEFSGPAPKSGLRQSSNVSEEERASASSERPTWESAAASQLELTPTKEAPFNESKSPRSERKQVLEMFNKFFTRARSHDDQLRKEFVRDGVVMRLRELGFQTSFLQKSRFEFRRRPAFSYNMISILPGKRRQTSDDRIVLVGAHWDSATMAPGVDDNGSGSTCLLEIARLISESRCAFNHTIMLVWFDYEEQGKYGSEFFVNDYLFPLELEKFGSKFIGAYILDMILVRDKENNTQSLPLNLKTVSRIF